MGKRVTHRLRWYLSLAMLVLLLTYLLTAYSIYSFSFQYQAAYVDALVVLGAAVDGNEPVPVFQERINHAIELYTQGYSDTILFTGGRSPEDVLSEAEAAREYALERGVDEEDILLETTSRITEENLINAHSIGTTEGLATYCIVSDPLHMKRAMVIAEHIGMDAYPAPTPTSAYRTPSSRIPFLLREAFYLLGYYMTLPFR